MWSISILNNASIFLPRIALLMSWGGPNIEPRSDHWKTPFSIARCLLSRIIATMRWYCCAYALLWECCCIATNTCRLVLLRFGYRCSQRVGGFHGRLPHPFSRTSLGLQNSLCFFRQGPKPTNSPLRTPEVACWAFLVILPCIFCAQNIPPSLFATGS
jgi:hypothetical protein